MKLVIQAGRTGGQYWSDLWRFRELFYVLAWRDIAVRYRQTLIGIAWAFLQPVLTAAVTVFVFGHLAKMPSGGVPYPLLVFTAILPWQFFSSSISGASQSLVAGANLISKVYFPRLIVPTATLITALADFGITSTLLVAMMAWYHAWPGASLFLLPGCVFLLFVTALGPGLLLTALMVRFRDVRIVVPFILQFGLYLAPVGYRSDVVRQKFGAAAYHLYCLNPMVGVIDGFRAALLGGAVRLDPAGFLISLGVSGILFVLGIWYFRRTERTFADVI